VGDEHHGDPVAAEGWWALPSVDRIVNRIVAFCPHRSNLACRGIGAIARYLLALSRNLNARGYQRAARQLLKTRLRQMPAGIWRNAVQFGLVFHRARAALTAILAGWIAGGLVEHTGGGQFLQVCVIVIAVLSYWSRPALVALFALAGAALAAPICGGLPAPWPWVCLALAALAAGGLVPYGAPVIAWLLSVSRVRLLILRPIGRRFSQLSQRMVARLQSDTIDDE